MKLGATDISKVYLGNTEVSKAYLGSTLVHGSDGPVLPYDAEVEYLQSAGTQWIETDYYPNDATVIQAKYLCNKKEKAPFAVRWSGASTYDTFGAYVASTSRATIYYGRFSDNKYANINVSSASAIELTIGLNQIKLNANTANITRDSFTSTYPLFLFCMNNEGLASMGAPMLLYSLTITEGANTIMDLIPVRKSGVGYMYDKVSGNLFGNDGSGSFTYGNDKN